MPACRLRRERWSWNGDFIPGRAWSDVGSHREREQGGCIDQNICERSSGNANGKSDEKRNQNGIPGMRSRSYLLSNLLADYLIQVVLQDATPQE